MQDFVIRISTPANLSGASATHQALVAVTGAAEKLIAEERAAGRSADELGGKVAKLRDAGGGFTGLSDGAAKAGKSMRQLAGDSEGFLAKIKTGFGIGLGEKLLHSVEEIGHAFSEAVRGRHRVQRRDGNARRGARGHLPQRGTRQVPQL